MISVSHNPYYDNGIQLVNKNGEKMEEEMILKVFAYLDRYAKFPWLSEKNRQNR